VWVISYTDRYSDCGKAGPTSEARPAALLSELIKVHKGNFTGSDLRAHAHNLLLESRSKRIDKTAPCGTSSP